MRNQLIITIILLSCLFCVGCSDAFRFAPTESQKQITFHTRELARVIEAEGSDAHSPASKQLLAGTTANLKYTGLPDDIEIPDFPAILDTAIADAVRRPTIADISEDIDSWLGVGISLATFLGVGGVGFGGKKFIDWLILASQKNQALAEIVRNNEKFKTALSGLTNIDTVVTAFKQAQSAQSPPTKRLVTELKS